MTVTCSAWILTTISVLSGRRSSFACGWRGELRGTGHKELLNHYGPEDPIHPGAFGSPIRWDWSVSYPYWHPNLCLAVLEAFLVVSPLTSAVRNLAAPCPGGCFSQRLDRRGKQTHNVKFGGRDMKTLYVTARTSLYTVRMKATGHRFPAGSE
jgi:hypothetical protein